MSVLRSTHPHQGIQMPQLTTYQTAAASDREAVIRIVKGLAEMGWEPKAYSDGEDRYPLAGFSATPEAVADDLLACDDGTLSLQKGENKGLIFFVFGNAPWEVAADSSAVEPFMSELATVEEAVNLEGK